MVLRVGQANVEWYDRDREVWHPVTVVAVPKNPTGKPTDLYRVKRGKGPFKARLNDLGIKHT